MLGATKAARRFLLRGLSTQIDSTSGFPRQSIGRRARNPIPVPHRTISDPKGQDLDYVNVVHSHLIHSDWEKLEKLSADLSPLRAKHVLLKIQKDHVLSLEFFNWAQLRRPNIHSLDNYSIMLHILAKNRKFKAAESILRSVLIPCSRDLDFPGKLFDSLLYSYRLCNSSPCVFDVLFKTFAHLKKLRNASDALSRMKDYGFMPNVKSCNAFLSSSIDMGRDDIVLSLYREMQRSRISPNEYTLNMVISALCKGGKLDKAVELLESMEGMGCSPSVTSYNVLIAGYCDKGLLSSALKLKRSMEGKKLEPDVITFNTVINGFCKAGKLSEANRMLSEMKASNRVPNTVTYNTLIYGYSESGNTEMAGRLFEEMLRYEVKADVLTYNALILGYCKEGKTKKAAYLVKELDKKNLVPNSSTFSALIQGQCVRSNPDRGLMLYRSMIRSGCQPNSETMNLLLGCFCKCKDTDGVVEVLREMANRSIAPDTSIVSELRLELIKQGRDQIALNLCGLMEAP